MPDLLIVDANRNIREFCRRELGREGYQISLAASARDALAALHWWKPALIILDGRIESRSGVDLLTQIEGLYPGLPVILYTEYADTPADSHPRGVRAVVRKTGDLAELKSTIAGILGLPGGPAPRAAATPAPATG